MVRADPSVASPAVPVSQEKAKKKVVPRWWALVGCGPGAADPSKWNEPLRRLRTLDIPDEKWMEMLQEREGVEAARGNGNIGPDCGASDPGAPSGLPDDLNGILPELASADFSKMQFKWSGLDAI